MVQVSASCQISRFRDFVIQSTCRDVMPRRHLGDRSILVERAGRKGEIYAKAVDIQTICEVGGVTLVRVRGLLSYTYNSMSGTTNLRWEAAGAGGTLKGRASANSVGRLGACRVLGAGIGSEYCVTPAGKGHLLEMIPRVRGGMADVVEIAISGGGLTLGEIQERHSSGDKLRVATYVRKCREAGLLSTTGNPGSPACVYQATPKGTKAAGRVSQA